MLQATTPYIESAQYMVAQAARATTHLHIAERRGAVAWAVAEPATRSVNVDPNIVFQALHILADPLHCGAIKRHRIQVDACAAVKPHAAYR